MTSTPHGDECAASGAPRAACSLLLGVHDQLPLDSRKRVVGSHLRSSPKSESVTPLGPQCGPLAPQPEKSLHAARGRDEYRQAGRSVSGIDEVLPVTQIIRRMTV